MGGYRAWVSALSCLACATALSGCPVRPGDEFHVASDQRHYAPDEWDQVVAHYRAFLKRRGGPMVGATAEGRDPRGVFKGSARVKARAGGGSAPGRLVAALDRASTAGKITGAYRGAKGNLSIKGLVLLHGRGATGSLCLAYSGEAIRSDQLFKGKFQVLGGTKREATLRGSGNFLSLQPNQLKSYYQP